MELARQGKNSNIKFHSWMYNDHRFCSVSASNDNGGSQYIRSPHTFLKYYFNKRDLILNIIGLSMLIWFALALWQREYIWYIWGFLT
jgi:hypothetical protein